jgi:MoaD family protein
VARARYFAALRDITGRSQDDIDAASVGDLVKAVIERYGEKFKRSLPFTKVAVNGRLVSELDGDETKLQAADEVAFLPPVSGGGFGGSSSSRSGLPTERQ